MRVDVIDTTILGNIGLKHLLGDFEQMKILRLIHLNPGIYLYELLRELVKSGICVSNATICRTLNYMGCSRQAMYHVALQQSETSRARFVAEVLVCNPSMLVCLDESGCDQCHTVRKYGYSLHGKPCAIIGFSSEKLDFLLFQSCHLKGFVLQKEQ